MAKTVSVALVGSGGAGVITAGTILLEAAAKAGWYGLMTRSLGPQIRGGESAALLRFAVAPVEIHADAFDVLIAIDWNNFDRLADEIPLDTDALVISGDADAAVPKAAAKGEHITVTLQPAGTDERANMVAVGLAGGILGLPEAIIGKTVARILASKGDDAVESARRAIHRGIGVAAAKGLGRSLAPVRSNGHGRWLLSGNQATGYGAIASGIRFVAAYPITPATDILEWMAPVLGKVGGALVQAEDELAALNMLLGASFGGVPSFTATSGPGLSLMVESLGLAVAAELPIVVANVMRCGPSTGIATKSEQSDLNIAVYGMHGDAPHIVVAPTSLTDCLFTSRWAVHLAEALHTPAIFLSDQALGQTLAIVDAPVSEGPVAARGTGSDAGRRRYAVTESGVSAMNAPGMPDCQYTAEGLAHGETGRPSTRAHDHIAQLDKRARKLAGHDYGDRWADIEGEGALAVITWGSSCGPVREALRRRAALGKTGARLIALRLILPAQPERMAAALNGVERVLIVEQSHSGQLHRFLKAHYALPALVACHHRPGPLPLTPNEIVDAIERMS